MAKVSSGSSRSAIRTFARSGITRPRSSRRRSWCQPGQPPGGGGGGGRRWRWVGSRVTLLGCLPLAIVALRAPCLGVATERRVGLRFAQPFHKSESCPGEDGDLLGVVFDDCPLAALAGEGEGPPEVFGHVALVTEFGEAEVVEFVGDGLGHVNSSKCLRQNHCG